MDQLYGQFMLNHTKAKVLSEGKPSSSEKNMKKYKIHSLTVVNWMLKAASNLTLWHPAAFGNFQKKNA